jgi:membrane-bound inhibitor of C-type lysozyme
MVKKVLCIVLLLAVTSVSTVMAKGLYRYKCDDGRIFTITFTEKDEARLVFSNSKTVEILENQMAGSGICYGNDKYEYTEHQGKVTLSDFTKPKNGNSVYEKSCHEIK